MYEITVITTGGTIDKVYGRGGGVRDLHIGDPVVHHILSKFNFGMPVSFFPIELFRKDSLDITDDDRRVIAKACMRVRTPRILITHGTDTMVKTAKLLDRTFLENKTIVLTGASSPACMAGSDAEINVALALGACLHARPQIYIAMNGVHFATQCRKNENTGIFEQI